MEARERKGVTNTQKKFTVRADMADGWVISIVFHVHV